MIESLKVIGVWILGVFGVTITWNTEATSILLDASFPVMSLFDKVTSIAQVIMSLLFLLISCASGGYTLYKKIFKSKQDTPA